MSDQIDRTVLPIRRPPFRGVANQTLGGSQPEVAVLYAEGDFGSVLGVAQQGMAPGGGLDADLVRAPGFQADFQPGSPRADA